MRSAKKSPEELQALRHTLVSRLTEERPDVASAARWIREALGLSQGEFAGLIGLSKPQIAKLERGETNPTLETLLAIGKPFGLRIGFYLPGVKHVVSPTQVSPESLGEGEVAPLIPPSQTFPPRSIPRTATKIGVPKLTFTKKSP